MRIAYGATRVVLLTRTKAIKIARFGICRFPLRLLEILRQPALIPERFERFHIARRSRPVMLILLLKFVTLMGLHANRQEHRLYKERPDLPLAPVYGLYLGGLILVMERGAAAEPASRAPLREKFNGGDLGRPCNVCTFPQGLLFVDYGDPRVPSVLGVSLLPN